MNILLRTQEHLTITEYFTLVFGAFCSAISLNNCIAQILFPIFLIHTQQYTVYIVQWALYTVLLLYIFIIINIF